MPVKKKILQGTAVVAALTACAQVTGLLSQTLIAAWFGASADTDAYFLAIAVVGLVTHWILLPIRQVVVPMFRHDLVKRGEPTAWRNVSVLLNDLAPLFLVITVAGWFAAPWLVRIVGAGFSSESAALSTSLTRILLVSVLVVGVGALLAQIHNSYHRFFLPGLGGSLSNLATCAGIVVLGSSVGIAGVAIGHVAGAVLTVAVLLPILYEHRRYYSATIDYRRPEMRELLHLSVPVLLGAGANQTSRIVDRFFASFLSAGSLSAIAYARLLSSFPQTMLLDPFQTTTYPHFTKLVAAEDYRTLSHQLFRYLRFLSFLTLPAVVGILLLDDVIVDAIFRRGAFDETAALLTTQALACYAIGLPAVFAGRVLHGMFIALKDTRTAMRLGVARVVVKITGTVVLLPFFAHAAIPLAESLSFLVLLAGALVLLPAPMKAGQLWPTLRSLAETAGLTAVMGGVVFLAKSTGTTSSSGPVELVGLILLGAATYLGAGWLARQPELEWIGRNLSALANRRLAQNP